MCTSHGNVVERDNFTNWIEYISVFFHWLWNSATRLDCFRYTNKTCISTIHSTNFFGYLYVRPKSATVKLLGTKVQCTIVWPYTEGTWMYCDYFIWFVSCTVFVLTCFVTCECVYVCALYVWLFWQLCGCFGNICTCIDCVLYCLYRVIVLFRLCIF